MRLAGDASAHCAVAAIERAQQALFGDELAGPLPPAVNEVAPAGTDASGKRRVRCPAAEVAENLKRHGLPPLELARFIRSRADAGESNATIARELAVDETTVAHHRSVVDCGRAVQNMLNKT